jgi:major membrane immunogen (membrane-anchored lipoprotein)
MTKELFNELIKEYKNTTTAVSIVEILLDDCTPDELADLCIAKREGRYLPPLPCKVGDTMYFIDSAYNKEEHKYKDFVNHGYVKTIKIQTGKTTFVVEYEDPQDTNGRCKGNNYFMSSVGKTVFHTPEEAANLLKKEN